MVATLTIVATQIHVHVYVSSDPPWAILIAVVATLAAAFGGVLLTQRFENKRWQAQQRITANLAAANRLASTYSKLLIGAWAVESASKDLATAESDPGKLQAIRAILDTRKEMDGVLAALLIDPSASEVRAAYRESSRASAAFVIDPTDPDLLATVEETTKNLMLAAAAHLQALDIGAPSGHVAPDVGTATPRPRWRRRTPVSTIPVDSATRPVANAAHAPPRRRWLRKAHP